MGGLEFLRGMESGALSVPLTVGPLAVDVAVAGRGRVVVTCAPDESLYDAAGLIFKGVVCALLDRVTGYAVLSMLAPGQGHTPVEMKISYLDAIRCRGGALTAVGTVTRLGSRVGFAEAIATDAAGDVLATATSSALIFDV